MKVEGGVRQNGDWRGGASWGMFRFVRLALAVVAAGGLSCAAAAQLAFALVTGDTLAAPRFDTFAGCSHIKVPMGDVFGNPMLALGMWYYQLLEKLR